MTSTAAKSANDTYRLDDQVGFKLRRASQRHLALFSKHIPEITSTQFAVLSKLDEKGALSQNALGREAAMDAATIKGVVDRLKARGLLVASRDQNDRRRTNIELSQVGGALYARLKTKARQITEDTLDPLSKTEAEQLLNLLQKLAGQ